MAIALGGEFCVAKPREEVFAFLTDPKRFAPLLPDFESMTEQDKETYTVSLKVGIAHIRGTAKVHLRLAEADAPRRAMYAGKGGVPGGTLNLTAGFDLADEGGVTRVTWKGEAQLHGHLVSMAGGLLEPLARKNVQRLIDSLQNALA